MKRILNIINMMKILIHGATNVDNYGDCLFAKMFYNYLSKNHKDCDVYFYQSRFFGIGDFLRKDLKYNKYYSRKDLRDFDLLIYMSGGFFGERVKKIKSALYRNYRYLIIGKKMINLKKDIIISGTGAGPIFYRFLRKKIVKVMNYSTAITLRDEKSENYMKSYGVENDIEVTADTALLLTKENISILKEDLKKKYIDEDKTNVLIHLVDLLDVQEKYKQFVIPILNNAFKSKQYNVIMSYDVGSARINAYKNNDIWNNIICENKKYYHYKSVDEMNSLINSVDVVITSKLHVGIVASVLGKSVISLPLHSEKTKRYYEQINEPERCCSLTDLSQENFEYLFYKYKDLKIHVPEDLKIKAQKNFDVISEYINKNTIK